MHELAITEKKWGMESMVSACFRVVGEETHEAYQLSTLHETYSWDNIDLR
jgi:hypothetical protein